MSGCIARAWANARPGDRPSRSTASSTATRISALPRLQVTTSGADELRDLAMRSVESRRSHRLSMRGEDESFIVVAPFKNPGSGRAVTIADKVGGQARSDFPLALLASGNGRGSSDNPAGGGSGCIVWWRGAQQECQRAALRSRE